jgi:hypothetical protein
VVGLPYNLYNFNISSQIKKSYYTSNVTASFYAFASDAANGVITLALDSSTTANIYPGRYVYDLKIISTDDGANNTFRVLEGIVNLAPQVTR